MEELIEVRNRNGDLIVLRLDRVESVLVGDGVCLVTMSSTSLYTLNPGEGNKIITALKYHLPVWEERKENKREAPFLPNVQLCF